MTNSRPPAGWPRKSPISSKIRSASSTTPCSRLQRGLKEGKNDFSLQIEIIREEIERSDHIITQLMGYAQLSEGRVEKLNLAEELDRAIAEVLPPGANYDTKIHRDYGAESAGSADAAQPSFRRAGEPAAKCPRGAERTRQHPCPRRIARRQ